MRFVILSALLIGSLPAVSETKQQMIQRLSDRYDDFFARRAGSEKQDQFRQRGAGHVREDRQQASELMERARQRYVLNRKPPPDMTEAFQQHLKEQERERQRQLERERVHARMKAEVERILQSGKKIPDVLEYDLQDAL